MAHLRIGSRGSQLARWQANHIAALLRARGHEVAIEIIKTTGDKITDVALAKVGTKGMFTKEIEEALAADRVDLAVHSLKDLPTEISSSFAIAAITQRVDPRDVFCSRKYASIEALPNAARVGTSSLRRQAQLKALRADLDIHPLRGNVDTRLAKLEAGEYDAVILAAAGLTRLGKTELIKQVIPAEIMCPAAGQGALGIEATSRRQGCSRTIGIPRRSCRTLHYGLRTGFAGQAWRGLPGPHWRIGGDAQWPLASPGGSGAPRRFRGAARIGRRR